MKGDKPPARLLDLSRSMRRAGRVATGVDRVELAYLKHLLAEDVPLFGLARTGLGYVLIDRAGLTRLADNIEGRAPWDAPDLLSRLPRGRDPAVQAAETSFRRLAVARSLPRRLPRMIKAHLPEGSVYINVGHANLTDRVCSAIRAAGLRTCVLIHDVIPLDYPQYQRPGSVAVFEKKLRRVRAHADLIVYISNETRNRAEAHLRQWGDVPTGVVAHLGVDVPRPDRASLPPGLPPKRPYFVTVGTIEPRKNHAFLLDLWAEMGDGAPDLLICGTRGWANDAVFARLDALDPEGPVRELAGLSDGALAALIEGANGLLFPSHAEGFGLPPAEALALGTRILCNDLSVLGEFLADRPVYASPDDRYLWINTIKKWVSNPPEASVAEKWSPPSWSTHFKTVLRLI